MDHRVFQNGSPAAPITPAMPPRPAKPLSGVGVVRAAARNSLSFCDEELFDRLVVKRRYGLYDVVFVSDPAGVRRVLMEEIANYPRWESSRRLFERELKTGTLSSEGETWRRHRRIAQPSIDPRAVAPDLPELIAIAERVARELDPIAKRGKPFDLQAWLMRFSTAMWNHVVSGGDPRGLIILSWFARVPHKPRALDLLPKPGWLADILKVKEDPQSAEANAVLNALIEERRAPDYAGSKDLIWRMVHAVDRATNEQLPPSEVRDEIASLITGGVATVRAMTWIWYLLALHPEAEGRLHAEIDEVIGRGPIHPGHIQRLAFARQTLDETMRLYPPIPAVLRQAAADDEICGVRVRRKSIVLIMPWIIHRHRELWTDPDLFDPDRFSPERSAERKKLAYIPFAFGPRICIAAGFATTQLMIAIAVLARRYRFRLADGRTVSPAGAVSLRVDGGLWVTVEKRS